MRWHMDRGACNERGRHHTTFIVLKYYVDWAQILLSEQHCDRGGLFSCSAKETTSPDFATNSDCCPIPPPSTDDAILNQGCRIVNPILISLHYTTHQQRHVPAFGFMQKHEILRINIQKSSGKYQP